MEQLNDVASIPQLRQYQFKSLESIRFRRLCHLYRWRIHGRQGLHQTSTGASGVQAALWTCQHEARVGFNYLTVRILDNLIDLVLLAASP